MAYTPEPPPPLNAEPTAAQLFPSHFARFPVWTPPAIVNRPPAYILLPDTANANTSPLIPDPNGDHAFPSHLAMFLARMPPAVVKPPPAYKSDPEMASAFTT